MFVLFERRNRSVRRDGRRLDTGGCEQVGVRESGVHADVPVQAQTEGTFGTKRIVTVGAAKCWKKKNWK